MRKYGGSVAFYTGVKHTYKLMQRVRPPSKSIEKMDEGRLFWFRDIQEATYFDIDIFGASFSYPKVF